LIDGGLGADFVFLSGAAADTASAFDNAVADNWESLGMEA
tara:strand:+ start:376 stop:495 length:120 start_codon:yes stop_codon:yes gene_type:complete